MVVVVLICQRASFVAFLSASVTAGVACGGAGGSSGKDGGTIGVGGVVSCTVSSALDAGTASAVAVMLCLEVENPPPQGQNPWQGQCANPGSFSEAGVSEMVTMSSAPCSRSNAVGGCSLAEGGATITVWYYANELTSDMVRMICQGERATFVAP